MISQDSVAWPCCFCTPPIPYEGDAAAGAARAKRAIKRIVLLHRTYLIGVTDELASNLRDDAPEFDALDFNQRCPCRAVAKEVTLDRLQAAAASTLTS